jgi:hypothetical protein
MCLKPGDGSTVAHALRRRDAAILRPGQRLCIVERTKDARCGRPSHAWNRFPAGAYHAMQVWITVCVP